MASSLNKKSHLTFQICISNPKPAWYPKEVTSINMEQLSTANTPNQMNLQTKKVQIRTYTKARIVAASHCQTSNKYSKMYMQDLSLSISA